MEEIVFFKTPTPSIIGVAETDAENGNKNNDSHCVVLGENKDLSLLKIQMPPPQYSPPHGQQQRQHQILVSGAGGGIESTGPRHSSAVTLPSHVAIPVGLAQVFVGGSMVICGSFALRYQSYLFYYGSGLWAGTLAGIAGILAVMATKKGLPKPKWLCGGKRWQIHIFLAAVMLSLSTAILAAIFSTSGLVRDTQHDFSKSVNDMTADEEMFEKRKFYGVTINAILLLLTLLQILLSFCSLGIALRVLCSNAYCHNGSSLLSSDSDGSEVTVREILGNGTGPEYEARKDRLLRWLGHQRRNFFVGTPRKGALAKNVASSIHSNSKLGMNRIDTRFYPRFVAVQPSTTHYMHPHHPPPGSLPYVIPVPLPHGPHSLPAPYPYPQPLMVPIIPLPIRQPLRPQTPSSVFSEKQRRRRRGGHSTSGSSVGGKSRRSSSVPRTRKSEEKNKEVEITEEEVGKTYTGLDRVAAEDFISNTMNSH